MDAEKASKIPKNTATEIPRACAEETPPIRYKISAASSSHITPSHQTPTRANSSHPSVLASRTCEESCCAKMRVHPSRRYRAYFHLQLMWTPHPLVISISAPLIRPRRHGQSSSRRTDVQFQSLLVNHAMCLYISV